MRPAASWEMEEGQMSIYNVILTAMFATGYTVALAIAAAECVREMHARTVRRHRNTPQVTQRPLYVEDLRRGHD